jgi:hypothetical protein
MVLDPEIALALERVQAGGWLPLTGGTPAQARTKYRDLSLVRRGEGYLPEPVAEVGDTTFAVIRSTPSSSSCTAEAG